MKQVKIDTKKLKIQITQGLDLSFKKLVKQKQAENGFLILSEKGQIKKVRATDIDIR